MSTDNITAYNQSLTPEEKSVVARQGGIKSGEVRRQNKVLRDGLNESLDPETVLNICDAIIKKALKGDVKAFEVIRNTIDPEWRMSNVLFNNDCVEFNITIENDEQF